MTTNPPDVIRIPIGHSVRYAVRSLPDLPFQHGPGAIRPHEITLTYRAAPDSQLGRVHAYVQGRLWAGGREVFLAEGYGQHYDDGLDGWPEWLTEEARLHDPDAAPAVVSSPPDTTTRDRVAAALTPFFANFSDWESARINAGEATGAVLAVLTEDRDEAQAQANLDALADLLPSPTGRAAVLREAADIVFALEFQKCRRADTDFVSFEHAWDLGTIDGANKLRRLAAEAQQPETPTPCGPAPDQCDPETGEPCDVHETERAHAEGDHEHCGPTCEVQFPSEQMRNFILAKGYPGTAGMLDELLRRAAAGVRQQPDTCGEREPEPRTGTSPCVMPPKHGGTVHRDKWGNQWPAVVSQPGKETDTDRIVAYRDKLTPRVLLCRQHGEQYTNMTPLTADDLPDGGICTFGRLSSLECGRDLLNPPPDEEA